MNKIPNRQAVCDILVDLAASDDKFVVLCSDSRGSASLTPFAEKYPERFVEVGIAEQSLVSVAAGLARCGKRAWAASPACFLSTRSLEQIKVDVAYSNTNVKLLGISGGVSYGPLGMTHHSAQDIAAIAAIPGMRVYLPSDRFQTAWLIRELAKDSKPAYIRYGRNAVEDIYNEATSFEKNKPVVLRRGGDIALIACGEMLSPTLKAAELLEKEGIAATVLDVFCLKPLDNNAIIDAAAGVRAVLTIEEHAPFGGLGAMVAQVISAACPKTVCCLSLPDAPVVTGTSSEVFAHYGLDANGIAAKAMQLLKKG